MVKMISPYGNAVKEVNSDYEIGTLEKAGYKIFKEETTTDEDKAVKTNENKPRAKKRKSRI